MDVTTGRLYSSERMALTMGVKPENLVTIIGTPKAVRSVSKSVAKARRKQQKASRRANRK